MELSIFFYSFNSTICSHSPILILVFLKNRVTFDLIARWRPATLILPLDGGQFRRHTDNHGDPECGCWRLHLRSCQCCWNLDGEDLSWCRRWDSSQPCESTTPPNELLWDSLNASQTLIPHRPSKRRLLAIFHRKISLCRKKKRQVDVNLW